MMRGELWWVDLGLPYGSEPAYRHPVLIIQNDFFNNSRINTTVIFPLTTNELYAEAPGNVLLNKDESKLARDSVIMISQVKVIDKRRLIGKISKLNNTIMEVVENNLMFVLGIVKVQ